MRNTMHDVDAASISRNGYISVGGVQCRGTRNACSHIDPATKQHTHIALILYFLMIILYQLPPASPSALPPLLDLILLLHSNHHLLPRPPSYTHLLQSCRTQQQKTCSRACSFFPPWLPPAHPHRATLLLTCPLPLDCPEPPKMDKQELTSVGLRAVRTPNARMP